MDSTPESAPDAHEASFDIDAFIAQMEAEYTPASEPMTLPPREVRINMEALEAALAPEERRRASAVQRNASMLVTDYLLPRLQAEKLWHPMGRKWLASRFDLTELQVRKAAERLRTAGVIEQAPWQTWSGLPPFPGLEARPPIYRVSASFLITNSPFFFRP